MKQVSNIPSHNACFACGRLNQDGLALVFEPAGDGICCHTTIDSKYQSYDGIVHGGILASIVDAAMVNLVYQRYGGRPLTCSLELRYRASVRVGDQMVAEAGLLRTKQRIVWASCQINVSDRLCVEATAAFKIDRDPVSDC
jgi:uncharacterized protein (TIGR00369 family)